MIETMTALMFAPALGSPIGTIPPVTRQDIATFYSRRGCQGPAMGSAVEYSSRFDRMQSLYPSYRRSDDSYINTGVALRCNWQDVCTLPTVPVIGLPSPPAPPPPDTLEDALEDLQNCDAEETAVDAFAKQAKQLIEQREAAREAADQLWIEHGVVIYREHPGGPILMTDVKDGNVRIGNVPYSIDMPWPESGHRANRTRLATNPFTPDFSHNGLHWRFRGGWLLALSH